jgi:type IV secretion system protein VirD4
MPYDYSQGRYVHKFPYWEGIAGLERNLITFATTRSGKGATQIIPALLEWDDANVLIVDPKGEAAETTAKRRAKEFGQKNHILDPFKTTKFKPKERARYNPLDEIDPSKPSSFRQINALADGLVMRHDPQGEHWEGGGVEVIAGFIAHVLSAPEFEGRRNLVTMRQLLKLTGEKFSAVVDQMAENTACGGLAQTGAGKLLNTGSEAGHFLSTATSNTK